MAKAWVKENATRKTVAYLRASTSMQEASCPRQREIITSWAKAAGVTIDDWLVDDGLSGVTDDREQFQRLTREAQYGEIGAVVIASLDRLSRQSLNTFFVSMTPLADAGVMIRSVNEGDFDLSNPESLLILSLHLYKSSKESIDIGRRVAERKLQQARNGQRTGGRAPYGYRIQDKKFAIVPEQAEAVRQIFDWYVNGISINEIARRLNDRMERAWERTTVLNILRNPAYKGMVRIAGTWKNPGKHFTLGDGKIVKANRKDRGRNGPDKWTLATGLADPIINLATWEAAQALLKVKVQGPRKPEQSQFSLSGLVYCGQCGHRMPGVNNPRVKGMAYYCQTPARRGKHLCNGSWVREAVLLEGIGGVLVRLFKTKEIREGAKQHLLETLGDEAQAKEMARLERKAAKLEAQIKQGIERTLTAPESDLEAAREIVAKWREELACVQKEIEAHNTGDAKKASKELAAALDQIPALCDDLVAVLQNGEPAKIREALAAIIHQISYTKGTDGAEILLTFRPLPEVELLCKHVQLSNYANMHCTVKGRGKIFTFQAAPSYKINNSTRERAG